MYPSILHSSVPGLSKFVSVASGQRPRIPGPLGVALLLGAVLLSACEGEAPKEEGFQGTTEPSPIDTAAADDIPDPVYDLDHDGFSAEDGDCDDNDWAVFPSAEELCDGKDNDCDGSTDEGWDGDGDGHLPPSCNDGDDCNDADRNINPDAADIPYDGIDQNCDGVDNLDADNDGFDAIEEGGNDCDDADGLIYPGATEVPKDGIDQDCNGLDLLDADGDGFDDDAFGGTDCNDADSLIFPDAWEWLNDEVDSDCDGTDGRAVEMTDAEVMFSGSSGVNGYFGFSMDLCDLDNDGQQDLVISAPLAGTGSQGQVGVFLGRSSGDWDTAGSMVDADILISGESVGFGMGVACGDVDGDGVDDLLASQGEYGSGTDFAIHVWYGGGIWTAAMGPSDADAALTVDMYASGSTSTVYSLGFVLGDLDGDGTDDIVLSTDVEDALEGLGETDDTIWLIPGGLWTGSQRATDVTDGRIRPDQDGIVTGMYVSADINGDGKPELVVNQGNYWSDLTGTRYTLGRTSFISGWPAYDDQVALLAFGSFEGVNGINTGFGSSSVVADIDADGQLDLLACAPKAPYSTRTNSGACYLLEDVARDLTATGLLGTTYSDASVFSGYQDGYFGQYASDAGDVDGDGGNDVWVVEPAGGTGSRGRTLLLASSLVAAGGGLPDDTARAEFTHANSYTSTSVSRAAGDIDGDGVTDFVFSGYGYGRSSASAGTYQGRVWVWLSTVYLAP